MTAANEDDALFEELENEIENDLELAGLRERRLDELRQQMNAAQRARDSNYGKLQEFKLEKQVIDTIAKVPRAVLHFYHRDFRRCKVMDSHLEKLAPKHLDTLFLRAEVSDVPFLVNKLGIKVLPCVIGFVDGISKMKITGFEDLQGGETGDNFSTASLELVMHQNGIISSLNGSQTPFSTAKVQKAQTRPNRRIRTGRSIGSDSD